MNQQEEDKQETKPVKRKVLFLRIAIPILLVLVAAGLYFLKNPIGANGALEATIAGSGKYQTAAFNLDATTGFDMKQVLSHGLPVILDFGADTCVPCKEMAPVLAALNQELRGKAVVKFVDVWKNTKAAEGLPLEVIPTQFFFNADGSPYVPDDPETAADNGFILYSRKDTGVHVYTVHQGGLDKATILAVLNEMGMK